MLRLFVFVLFVTFALSQPFVKVYIGCDANTLDGAVESAQHLFDEEIYFTKSYILDLSDTTQVILAMEDMDVLFLTSGTQEFLVDTTTESMIEIFVSSGGIIIYSADESNLISNQVADWLDDPKISVTAVQSYFTVNYYYYQNYMLDERDYNNYSYYKQFRGVATNASLGTSFGRSGRFHSDYNFQSFAPDLYWINYYNRGMLVNEFNRNYCMFIREGEYGVGNHADTCFLFSFPHNNGYVVELSADFSRMGIFGETFTNTTIRAIEGAIRLNKPVVSHTDSVIMSSYDLNYNYYYSFVNLVYDLSQKVNVYLWHNYDIEELYNLLELTGANTIIVDEMKISPYPSKGIPIFYFTNGNLYYEFITNGGNMVITLYIFIYEKYD